MNGTSGNDLCKHIAARARRSVQIATIAVAFATGGQAHSGDLNEQNFMINCQGCHMATGAGIPGAVPDMRGVVGALAATERGRRYLVRVPGVAFSQLDDESLANLVTWLVRKFDPEGTPANFRQYTPSEIADGRKHALRTPGSERAELLAALASRTGYGGAQALSVK